MRQLVSLADWAVSARVRSALRFLAAAMAALTSSGASLVPSFLTTLTIFLQASRAATFLFLLVASVWWVSPSTWKLHWKVNFWFGASPSVPVCSTVGCWGARQVNFWWKVLRRPRKFSLRAFCWSIGLMKFPFFICFCIFLIML